MLERTARVFSSTIENAVVTGLPELARSYLTYAHLLTAAGDIQQARAHLTQAIDMFGRMGMDRDLGRAEQVLRELA